MEIMSSSSYRLVFTIYTFLCKEKGLETGGDTFAIRWIGNTYRLLYNGNADPTEFTFWIERQMNK